MATEEPTGQRLPQEGDRCLVAIDEDGEPWIVIWVPNEGEIDQDPIKL